jgi:predicted metal-dependent enzyme (double-stranded beta helix superfamily)
MNDMKEMKKADLATNRAWSSAANTCEAGLKEGPMAELMDAFITQCRQLRCQPGWPELIGEAMRALIAQNGLVEELTNELDPKYGGQLKYYLKSPDLTVFSIKSEGGLRGPPHDHKTRAVVGLVTGSEQFKIYSADNDSLTETGLYRVSAPSVEMLPDDIVHAMWNNVGEGGLSLHLYGNSFFDVPGRRIWNPYTFACEAFDENLNYQWSKELTCAARG